LEQVDHQSLTLDLAQLMAWSAAALSNRHISHKDADEISRLGKVYEQLFHYRAQYTERSGDKMVMTDAVPTIEQLKLHIVADEFQMVIAEAKRIRETMKPILQHAKGQVDALRK